MKLVMRPIPKNGVGSLVKEVVEPHATPPAIVTNISWFIYIFFFPKVQKSSAPTVLPTSANIVLLMTIPLPQALSLALSLALALALSTELVDMY